MKKIISIFASLLLLASCKSFETTSNSFDANKEIHILYTNIIPSSISPVDYYSTVKNKKNESLNITPNVTLIDTGNILNQDNGSYNSYIDIMNDIGYDYAIFGRYDFNNGLDYFYHNINKAAFKYLMCNVSYNGKIKDIFKNTLPYIVINYDGVKVGYVGVENPNYIEASPDKFMEDGNVVVNFYNETKEVFYDTVLCSIDKAKKMGSDYVVLVSNLDTYDDNIVNDDNYYIEDLVSYIQDVDVVINANEYTVNKELYIKDKNNKDVLVISNGPNENNSGKIVINNNVIKNEVFNQLEIDNAYKNYFNSVIN